MGNKLGRRRQVVDEKYTRPQGLYQHKHVDQKKLRKLILDSKLAPCYPGDDDCGCGTDLEECPICFLYYPSLNRSRCCMKGICTECFLQMKTPNSTRPTQCPFCKTSNYAVEYRGVKTKEEKGLEQLEEQRVIEAKIRMRQQELQGEEERMLKQREISSSSSMRAPTEADYCSARVPSFVSTIESEEIVASHEHNATSAIRPSPRLRQTSEEEFDLDLEDVMLMEAIWLSIQESSKRQDPPYSDASQSEEYMVEDCSSLAATAPSSLSSPSGGHACAVATVAERQQMSGDAPDNYGADMSAYTMAGCGRYTNREGQESEHYFPAESVDVASPGSQLGMAGDVGEWIGHHRLEVDGVGTSYGGSSGVDIAVVPPEDENQCGIRPLPGLCPGPGPIIPDSFEEQMMLAMAVSLAEARARANSPRVAWH